MGSRTPVATMSSTPLPSRFARWILAVSKSVQYILPPLAARPEITGIADSGPFFPTEPQSQRSKIRTVRGAQEQESPKVRQEPCIDVLEPFRKRSRPLLEIPRYQDLPDRVVSFFVADLKLDVRKPGPRRDRRSAV